MSSLRLRDRLGDWCLSGAELLVAVAAALKGINLQPIVKQEVEQVLHQRQWVN